MNENMMREKIHRAVDSHCTHLNENPWLAQEIIQKANRKTVTKPRRKLSVALVVVLLMVLLSTTAVAATVLYHFYSQNIATEAAHGYYQEWPLDEKIALVDRMLEESLDIDIENANKLHDSTLTDEEKETIADDIVIGYYGEGRDGMLSAANIMEHDMGQFDTWSLEDQAWYSEKELESGSDRIEYEFHKMPGENDISVDNAVDRARDILLSVTDIELEELITWRTTVSFMTVQINDGVNPPYKEDIYQIAFYEPGFDENPYGVQLTHDGQLLHYEKAHRLGVNEYIMSLWEPLYTPEDKAVFSQTIAPMIRQYIDDGEDVDAIYHYLASIDYLMPCEDYLSQEEAQKIADNAFIDAVGCTLEELTMYYPAVSLRRLSDGTVVWYIKYKLYEQYNNVDMQDEFPYGLVIQINAYNGSVVSIENNDRSEPFSNILE